MSTKEVLGSDYTAASRTGFAITPSDGTDLLSPTRAIYVGGAGNLSVILELDGDSSITLIAVPVGSLLPLRAKRVRASGTTATNLIGLA